MVSLPVARCTTWNGSPASTAWASMRAAACFQPENASMATTSTRSRKRAPRASGQFANARAYGSDRDRIRIPWARTARSSVFHEQPSVRAHADIDTDSNATRRNAQSTAARDSSVRPDTNALKPSCHMRAHVTHS